MARLDLIKDCGKCFGLGQQPIGGVFGGTEPCTACGATGELLWGRADAVMDEFNEVDNKLNDLESKINDVMDKCNDILEAIQNP